MKTSPLVVVSSLLATTAFSQGASKDFIEDAKLLFRVVGCAGNVDLPANIDSKVVEAHCKELRKSFQKYRQLYLAVAEPFLNDLKPKGLSPVVVYPFGGGDLLSALTTYSEAREVTTLSLEHSGDPRRLRRSSGAQLESTLKAIRQISAGLLLQNDSTSENLMKGERGDIPAQLAFFLMALSVHGYEPVSLKYFQLNQDGTPHYLSEAEIDALESEPAGALKASWTPSDFSRAFSNSELAFARKGEPNGEVRIHRHIAANLSDSSLAKHPSIMAYLNKRVGICAMTKAASYLLWRDDFSAIRNYLIANMTFMISDSTGIPPPVAGKGGFRQDVYGHFQGSFLNARADYNDAFRGLWNSSPPHELPFRYGYLDSGKQFHMLITVKKPATR